jgi:hypothetical protein
LFRSSVRANRATANSLQTLKRKIVVRNKKQHKKPVKMLRAPVDRFRLPRVRDSRTQNLIMVAAPFLKWAGGKRQLLTHIAALLPERIDTYFEPFLGGAAVFFRLAAEGRFRRAVLADANPDLVTCYQAIRDDVDAVIGALGKFRNDSALYYRVRQRDPLKLSATERAARLIYLNRCGYNGLYRVNSSGKFNVPFGRYARPVICDEDRLRAASAALKKARFVCGDFASTLKRWARATLCTSIRRTFRCHRPHRSPPTRRATSAPPIKRASPMSCASWGPGRCLRSCRTRTARRRGSSIAALTGSIVCRPAGPSTPSVTVEVPSTSFWSAASTTRLRRRRPSLV